MASALETVERESVEGRDLVGWSSDVEDRPRFEFEAEAGHLEILRAFFTRGNDKHLYLSFLS